MKADETICCQEGQRVSRLIPSEQSNHLCLKYKYHTDSRDTQPSYQHRGFDSYLALKLRKLLAMTGKLKAGLDVEGNSTFDEDMEMLPSSSS